MKVVVVYSLDDVQSVQAPIRSLEYIQMGISYSAKALRPLRWRLRRS